MRPGIASTRVSVASQYGSGVQIKVFLEATDGNVLTGARVSAESPGSSIQILGFSQNLGCYTGVFSQLLSGEYEITIASALLDDSIRVAVNHQIPEGKPNITSCTDQSGNNGMLGQSLQGTEDITLEWNSITGTSVYDVSVNQGVIQSWQSATAENTIIIPGNILSEGDYTVAVNAQWVDGDPLLFDPLFYSASESQGASFLLNVQE
ncbi:hypothetical protein [Spirochaeta lutea]|uniref:Bacterial Ig-like domain-containing protein n=1 Tax=Spirochaeta lutea TaxID=1480694 RepID=A0A098QXY6_9SPIO|nr:hypothetical protein [Spirochaeta lutea]KGE72396.1 hypothetical protein DC28_06900 [Spirochaeta lutea]